MGDPRSLVDINAPEYVLATLKVYGAAVNHQLSGEVIARVKVVHGA